MSLFKFSSELGEFSSIYGCGPLRYSHAIRLDIEF